MSAGQPPSAGEIETFLLASRALLGVASRSLGQLEGEVSTAQFRLLVVVGELGPAPSSRVARALGVAPSTVTRVGDKLVASGHLRRGAGEHSRSVVSLDLTPTGRRLVEEVLDRRRAEIAGALARLTPGERSAAAGGLEAFAAALGEGCGQSMEGPAVDWPE